MATRRVVWLLAVLLLLVRPAGGAVSEDLRRAIVVIGLLNPEEHKYFKLATAFYVGNGLFYTNAHVILAKDRIQKDDGPKYDQWILIGADQFGNPADVLGTAEVQCVDRRYMPDPFGDPQPFDTAAVRFTGSEGRLPSPTPISADLTGVGKRVRAIGFPQGAVLTEMLGTVTDVNPDRILLSRDRGTVALPGSSGSPLLNTRDEVVGILQAANVGDLVVRAVPIQVALGGCPR
jgi:S1-C subfamily serine protease